MTAAAPAPRMHWKIALFLALAMAATVGTALGFQYIGGYLPCKLCYEQRIPYYVGVPVMALALLSSTLHWPAWLTRALLVAGGLLMAWGLYMGIYHAGVEWQWWAGPTDCAIPFDMSDSGGGSGGVLDDIDKVIPPSCDKAALRILGLSFAGWNVIASLALGAVAFYGASRRR
ncbi:MAG: disulfide bond formation protein B [Rhizobiaceae bacterium]|nr:disulfide bond formation protein B [Rhizobiaceae bacterium]